MEPMELHKLGCREFDPRETMNQIIQGGSEKFLDWKISKELFRVFRNNNERNGIVGLLMKVNHKNYSDMVYITLSFWDYYNVYFFDRDFNMVHSIEEIDCENIFDAIDDAFQHCVKIEISLN